MSPISYRFLRVTAPTGCSSQIDIFFIYNNLYQYHFANRALGYAMYCTVQTVCRTKLSSMFGIFFLDLVNLFILIVGENRKLLL